MKIKTAILGLVLIGVSSCAVESVIYATRPCLAPESYELVRVVGGEAFTIDSGLSADDCLASQALAFELGEFTQCIGRRRNAESVQ